MTENRQPYTRFSWIESCPPPSPLPPTSAPPPCASPRASTARRSAALSGFLGGEAWLKLECEQLTGSFKLRGATNALVLLDERARATGVVASSAGNHGLGIAAAAKELGIAATVFVPRTAPAVKRDRIAAVASTVAPSAASYDAAES